MKRFIRYLDVYVRYRYDRPQHISFTQTVTFLHSLGRVQSFTVGRQSAKTRFLATILLISDDLDEVLALGDRIAVLHGGRLTAALPAAKWSRDSIGLAMTGLAPDTAMPTP